MLEVFARALNHYVRESTAALDLLRELRGKSFAVVVDGAGFELVLVAEGDGTLSVRRESGGSASATLRASPVDLVKLARAGSVGTLKDTRAELTGDLKVAESFATLLRLARPDLEEEAARWIGDLAARRIGQTARAATGWLARAAAAARMNAAEYLQEESRVLPASLEAQAFYGDVERLRDDVERAAARLARLEQQAKAACGARDSF